MPAAKVEPITIVLPGLSFVITPTVQLGHNPRFFAEQVEHQLVDVARSARRLIEAEFGKQAYDKPPVMTS